MTLRHLGFLLMGAVSLTAQVLPPGADPLTHARRLCQSARALSDRHEQGVAP